jgi:NAD(P)-dependent dehydrogenase (short-subunit alcohol dehydrogenase family)
MAGVSKAVLITGCSSGIGRASALRLAQAGWTVYATARRPETLGELEQAGARTLALDVTDEDSMRAAVERIREEQGAVGVLVNNAGYSQSGAIETVGMDAVRAQFETNVFGVVALTRMVLPGMREQRWGRIVNVGSMGGRLTFPGGGHYHATKYALEAISDALRFEVAGFGIGVTLLEPGLILTEFGHAASAALAQAGGVAEDGQGRDGAGAHDDGSQADPYATFNAAVGAITTGAYDGPMRHLGAGPDRVARVIERAISSKRAPSRVQITASARVTIAARRLLSDRAWDAAMRRQFPQPS